MSTYTQRLKVVENALSDLETFGWCKGNFVNNDGRVCVNGALMGLGGGQPIDFGLQEYHSSTYREVRADLEYLLPTDSITWNDAERRRKKDVVSTLRQLASMYYGLIEARKARRGAR